MRALGSHQPLWPGAQPQGMAGPGAQPADPLPGCCRAVTSVPALFGLPNPLGFPAPGGAPFHSTPQFLRVAHHQGVPSSPSPVGYLKPQDTHMPGGPQFPFHCGVPESLGLPHTMGYPNPLGFPTPRGSPAPWGGTQIFWAPSTTGYTDPPLSSTAPPRLAAPTKSPRCSFWPQGPGGQVP